MTVEVLSRRVAELVGIPAGRLGRVSRKILFALADDGLASTANFVLSFLLVRWLLPGEYGLFALLNYSVATGVVGFWRAAFFLPMSVLGPGRHGAKVAGYVALLGRWQGYASGAVLAGGGVLWLFLTAAGRREWAVAALGLAAALAGLTYMQFARRAAYVFRQPELAVVRSLVYVACLAGGIVIFARLGGLGAGTVLLIMGAAGALAGWAASFYRRGMVSETGNGDWKARELAAGPEVREVTVELEGRAVAAELWSYGRWTVASNLLAWAVTGLPYFFSAGLLGLGGTAAFQAGMNFIRPWLHVFTVFTLLTLPSLAASFARGGPERVRSLARRWAYLLALATLAYGLAVLLAGPWAYRVIYHGRYAVDLFLLGGLLIALVTRAGTTGLVTALQAAEKPEVGVAAQGAALAAGVLTGPLFVKTLGVSGLGLWAAAQGLAQLGVAAWAFRRVFAASHGSQAISVAPADAADPGLPTLRKGNGRELA